MHGGRLRHAALIDTGDVAGADLGDVGHVQGVGPFDGDHVVVAVQLRGLPF